MEDTNLKKRYEPRLSGCSLGVGLGSSEIRRGVLRGVLQPSSLGLRLGDGDGGVGGGGARGGGFLSPWSPHRRHIHSCFTF